MLGHALVVSADYVDLAISSYAKPIGWLHPMINIAAQSAIGYNVVRNDSPTSGCRIDFDAQVIHIHSSLKILGYLTAFIAAVSIVAGGQASVQMTRVPSGPATVAETLEPSPGTVLLMDQQRLRRRANPNPAPSKDVERPARPR
jgi:hypothetical protein